MDQNILEKNLQLLALKNPQLAENIKNHTQLRADYEINEAQSGDANIFRNGMPVHDNIDPIDEAIKVFKSLKIDTQRTINLVFGMGLGYLPKRFLMNSKGYVVVYEPDLDFLRITFELVDFSEELSSVRFFVVNNRDELFKTYEKIFFRDYELNFCFLDYYKYNYTQDLNRITNEVSDIHSIFGSNYKNLFQKSKDWNISVINNIGNLLNHVDLHKVKDSLKGKTAVIVSAGPSLDKNIELLRQKQDNVVIFAVGTAIKALINNGIKPDFGVVIEYYYTTMAQIKDVDLSDTYLILQAMAYKDLFNINAKGIFNYYANNENTTKFIGELWGLDLTDYQNKGTVSITALFSAKMLGCDKIILLGQDLAYTDGRCYSKNSVYKNFMIEEDEDNQLRVKVDVEKTAKELNVPENAIKAQVRVLEENAVKVKGYHGDFVVTSSGYALFVKYFEEIAREFNEQLTLINATEGGAFIEGFEHIPFAEALSRHEMQNIKPISIPAVINEQEKQRRSRLILKEIEKALAVAQKINKIIEKEKGLMAKTGQLREQFINLENKEEYKFFMDYFFKEDKEIFNILLNRLQEPMIDLYNEIVKSTFLSIFYIEPTLLIKETRKHENKDEEEIKYLLGAYINLLRTANINNNNLIKVLKNSLEEVKKFDCFKIK